MPRTRTTFTGISPRPARALPSIRLLLAAAVAGLGLAACGASSTPPSSSATTGPAGTASTSTATPPTDWIVADYSIAMFEKAGLSTSLIDFFFNNRGTYLILHPREGKFDAQLPLATKVDRFTSYAAMQQAFSTNAIPAGVGAVMYDNEAWSFTPANEKASPVQFAAQAEALVHAHGLKFIFTPATNLATLGLASAASSDKYQRFVAAGLPGGSAKVSDIYDIQSQQAEATPEFETFVRAAVAQARAANPHATVLIGIGPNPSGRTVSAQDVLDAYQATHAMVDGYWLNMPAGTAQCPQCGAAEPQVAVSFLQMLGASLGQR